MANGVPKFLKKHDFEFDGHPFCKYAQDKYVTMGKIGQGTFGEVHKARNRAGGHVAMKKILMDNEKEGFPITALREIQLLQKLCHKNVVRLDEICCSRGEAKHLFRSTFYLIFEFCEHDLAGLLGHPSFRFSHAEIKCVLQQLLNGLFYIHTNGVLHRDLKAANILITKNGVLKLADFGLARFATPSKRFTNRVVTLWYRPPELLLGAHKYGPEIDLWGAGCIMAEMWLRKPLMQGRTEQHQLNLISEMCGSLNPEVWPTITNLELYHKIELKQGRKRVLRERMRVIMKDINAVDLVDKFLCLDPSNRIDSDKALDHNFFWTDPLPADLGPKFRTLTHSMFESFVKRPNQGPVHQQPQPKKPRLAPLPADQHVERVF